METFELISLEELEEFEYNLAFNPFDTCGCGYLDDDMIEYLVSLYEEANEYYGQLEQD